MALVKLDIPAGFYRNGTEYEQSNRWRDGSLVRWRDGSLRPIGGWEERKVGFTNNPPRGMHTWESNDQSTWVAGGSFDELVVMTGSGLTYDISPADLTAGLRDASVLTTYGYGFYDTGFYGTPRPALSSSVPVPACTWDIDNWGEYLVACSSADGRLLEWQLNTAVDAAPIANAPTSNLGLVVTEERFIFALGADDNSRRVAWCDRENNTLWTPAATNEAGDIELQTAGQIMQGIRTRGQTLIITDTDAHTARYTGPPYVYGFERVGTSCGAISRKSAVDVDVGVFWMGQKGFFRFDGNTVSEIPCDVHDYVFSDFNTAQQSKVWGLSNGQYGEIWWFYPSENSVDVDRYVAFDYKENHWLIGSLDRTSGVERGVFRYPFMADVNGTVYNHEVGLNVDGQAIFAETGPISIANGDQVARVTEVIPDEKTQGDVDLTFKTQFYPNGDQSTHGPFSTSNPTSVRFTGRQIRMRADGIKLSDWRVGNMRIDVKAGGRR